MPDAEPTATARRERWPLDQRTSDVLLAIVLTGFAVVALALDLDEGDAATALSYPLAIIAAGSLAARRMYPAAVLATVVAGRLLLIWDVGNEVALAPAAAVALYTVARHSERKVGLLTATAGALVMGVAAAALGDEVFGRELLGEAAQGFLPIAVGDAVRSRADRVRDLIESEAEARVQAERLRIARDLHDVVAHGLSTIAIQSGVAAHLLDRDPNQAREALDVINATGKSSLEELRAMVGVLRSTDGAALRPTPTDPNDIGELIEGAVRAGVDVSCEISGAFPADVNDAAVVAVHRIVQEALTNVARHAAAARTVVRLDHGDHEVTVEVHNERPPGRPGAVASTGVGIVGMRERAASMGGSLDAGSTADGGYQVVAIVP
ncbi:MAG: two-component sensor histidine kinase, partial [Acidimicrobiales bacterium]|nr:two-component sensor histidine kinase [Acidimicrobiales bacterium]